MNKVKILVVRKIRNLTKIAIIIKARIKVKKAMIIMKRKTKILKKKRVIMIENQRKIKSLVVMRMKIVTVKKVSQVIEAVIHKIQTKKLRKAKSRKEIEVHGHHHKIKKRVKEVSPSTIEMRKMREVKKRVIKIKKVMMKIQISHPKNAVLTGEAIIHRMKMMKQQAKKVKMNPNHRDLENNLHLRIVREKINLRIINRKITNHETHQKKDQRKVMMNRQNMKLKIKN